MGEYSDNVEAAVMDTLSDGLPGPVIGFVGMANYLDGDGEVAYVIFNMPNAHLGESMGLALQLGLFYQDQYRRHLARFDGDDD